MKRLAFATGVAIALGSAISTAQQRPAQPPAAAHANANARGNPFMDWDDDGEVIHMLPPHGVAHGHSDNDRDQWNDDGTFAPVNAAGTSYASSYGSGNLVDHGGLEMANAGFMAIYWNSSVSSSTAVSKGLTTSYKTLQAELSDFVTKFGADTNFTNGASNNLSIVQQYGTKAAIAPTLSNLGFFVDSQANATSITDAGIQTYLAKLFAAGKVKPAANVVYGIYFPSGMNVQLTSSYVSCTNFCGYHKVFTYTTSTGSIQIKYAAFPYLGCTACKLSNLAIADMMTIVTGHEVREAITNPGDSGVTAWYDSLGYEADDKCAWHNLYQMTNGKFWMQPEWSNGGTKNPTTGVAYPGPGCIVPK